MGDHFVNRQFHGYSVDDLLRMINVLVIKMSSRNVMLIIYRTHTHDLGVASRHSINFQSIDAIFESNTIINIFHLMRYLYHTSQNYTL